MLIDPNPDLEIEKFLIRMKDVKSKAVSHLPDVKRMHDMRMQSLESKESETDILKRELVQPKTKSKVVGKRTPIIICPIHSYFRNDTYKHFLIVTQFSKFHAHF